MISLSGIDGVTGRIVNRALIRARAASMSFNVITRGLNIPRSDGGNVFDAAAAGRAAHLVWHLAAEAHASTLTSHRL